MSFAEIGPSPRLPVKSVICEFDWFCVEFEKTDVDGVVVDELEKTDVDGFVVVELEKTDVDGFADDVEFENTEVDGFADDELEKTDVELFVEDFNGGKLGERTKVSSPFSLNALSLNMSSLNGCDDGIFGFVAF